MSTTPLVHDGFCPIAKASKLIGDMWVILIIKELLQGPRRFSELEKSINCTEPTGKISSRTLSQRLKLLDTTGLITRKVYEEIPPHTEYSLTHKGQALSTVIDTLRQYGEQHL